MIVVLGMHASGTSLVSRLLMTMGVNMGLDFMGPVKGVPTWEDKSFVAVNADILTRAGGDWSRAPREEKIMAAAEQVRTRMKTTIMRKREPWGFKDPRTALTCRAWHPILDNPAYVVVNRPHEDVATSILERGPSAHSHEYWSNLSRTYYERIYSFLRVIQPPYVLMDFNNLITSNTAKSEVRKLAAFVMATSVPRMLKEINFR